MREKVEFKNKELLQKEVDHLEEYYSRLKDELQGDEPSPKETEAFSLQYIPYVYVDSGRARTAIDSMINALKEARKFFK